MVGTHVPRWLPQIQTRVAVASVGAAQTPNPGDRLMPDDRVRTIYMNGWVLGSAHGHEAGSEADGPFRQGLEDGRWARQAAERRADALAAEEGTD